MKKAEAILEEQRKEFDSWYECRDMVPRIHKLKKEAAEDLLARLVKIVHALPMETEQQETLLKDVEQAAGEIREQNAFRSQGYGLSGKLLKNV